MSTGRRPLLILGAVVAVVVAPVALVAPGSGTGSVAAGDSVAIQGDGDVTGLLDWIADILSQLNRVLEELSQLFGGGEGGGEGEGGGGGEGEGAGGEGGD